MQFILKNKDRDVLSFKAYTDQRGLNIMSLEVHRQNLLPISLQQNGRHLKKRLIEWIEMRRIPKHRQYMRQILYTTGVAENDILSYIRVGFALSLNDTFWIVPEGDTYLWQDYNLYNNAFSKALTLVALTGRSMILKGKERKPSPELTTHGVLKKCWCRKSGIIKLIKGQTGTEAYCEYYAAQIAKALGLQAISYDLESHQGEIVCMCEIFTSREVGFVSIAECIDYAKYKALGHNPLKRFKILAKVLGQEFLEDLLLFDALVFNTDRHLGNYGMLIDNQTNAFLAPAPIFDNGMAFLGQIGEGELANIPAFFEGVDSGLDINFEKQIDLAARPRHINKLEGLKKFTFARHPHYNLPEQWLQAGEKLIQQRSQEIIKIIEKKQGHHESG
ncbi:HipA family kinase [Helicobacter salomonis]|uniref:HipA family kinase n=1 Tax=Helicobacter salomonis TaxID=56878 RepID=UPI000CF19E8A|nr:HipA family kinase [Helicobacter salomonis]